MTIDTLRERKKELIVQRQRLEQEALGGQEAATALSRPEGGTRGDKVALALLMEELGDVNAQLRTLTHGGRRNSRVTNSSFAQDRQQFESWMHRPEEEDDDRGKLRAAAGNSLQDLTKIQRETLTLYSSGMNQEAIAAQLGVSPSTVSRNLSRAKKRAAAAVQRVVEGNRLMAEADKIDLNNREALRTVIRALTIRQLVYFYLYYSEGLNLREIGALLNVNHATVCRTIKRALLQLDKFFPGGAVLEHPEAVDEAAYFAWLELDAHPELAPEPVRALVQKPRPAQYYRDWRRKTVLAKPSVVVRRGKRRTPGKLLAALTDRQKNGLFRWFSQVFEILKRKLKGE